MRSTVESDMNRSTEKINRRLIVARERLAALERRTGKGQNIRGMVRLHEEIQKLESQLGGISQPVHESDV